MRIEIGRTKKPIVVALLLVAIIAGVIVILSNLGLSAKPKLDPKPWETVGGALAGEAARLLGNQGTVVVLSFEDDAKNALVDGFQKTLQQQKGLRLKTVEKLSVEQLKKGMGKFPSDLFLELLQKHSDAAAIVSFAGIQPELTAEEMARLPEKRPKILAFAPRGNGVRSAFQQGILDMAIVTRPPPIHRTPADAQRRDPGGKPSERAMFEKQYQVVTPDSDLSFILEPASGPGPRPP